MTTEHRRPATGRSDRTDGGTRYIPDGAGQDGIGRWETEMAYNDYGAFVYLDGRRRADCEDVPVFGERDEELAPGERIYANLIRQMQSSDDAYRWFEHCHHGVMGDGPVRVGVYKTGLWSCGVYVMRDGEKEGEDTPTIESINETDDILRLSGAEPIPFPEDYDGSEEQKTKADAHERQLYGPYRYEFEVEGHRIIFEAREYDGVVSPTYHARMTCPDGHVWDAFYDVSYGAGLSDFVYGAKGRDPRFDEIDADAVGRGDRSAWPVTRTLHLRAIDTGCWGRRSVRERRISVSGSTLGGLAASLGIASEGGDDDEHILYRSLEDATGHLEPVSTLSDYDGARLVEPDTVVSLIRLGIQLAKMGVDDVDDREGHVQGKDMVETYGLDGTPFEGIVWSLSPKWMVPGEIRHDKEHPLHDDERPQEEILREVFSRYEQACDESDGTVVIDENDAGVELTWPILDAEGSPFTPLQTGGGASDVPCGWQKACHAGDGEEEPFEVVGCGWRDEKPFVLTEDGDMLDPRSLVIVSPTDEEAEG